jgi:sarcosine oxidase delta subunit
MDRDRWGRFVPGNRVCYRGCLGLVAGPFQGDITAARAWLGQLGAHTYARQCLQGTPLEWRLEAIWKHPGTCEQFLNQWRQSLAFNLTDVEVVEP